MSERLIKRPPPLVSSVSPGTAELEADLRRAVALQRNGQLDEAERIYQNYLQFVPDHFNAQHLLGILKHQQGRHAEALELIKAALQKKPNHAVALSNYATLLSELKRFNEALASFDRAISLRPDFAHALNGRGIVLNKLRCFDEALASYNKAITVNAEYPEAFNNRGVTLSELKRFNDALASYDIAIGLKPDYAQAIYNRGTVLKELQRFDEALASYDRAIALDPDNAEAFNNRGIILRSLGRYDEGLASYDKAIALKPYFAEAFNNRGNALRELNWIDEALESYNKAIALDPGNAEAFNNRGIALQELKRFDEALASFDKAIALKPDYAAALNNLGNTLKELRRFNEALASFEKAIASEPNFAEAFNNRGTALHELKRFDEALASFDNAIALKPHFAEAFNNRGNALKELNCFPEALASYDKAIVLKPDNAEAFNNRAMELMELGRLNEARWSAERAIQLAPNRPRYYHTLGNVGRYVAGNPHVAAMEALARDASTLFTDDRIELHFALAKAYEDLGEPEKSFDQLLMGNALKRRQITYNEAKSLGAMNYARAAFTSDYIRIRPNVGNLSSVPVFIVGMPRSGSTLVEQILASHPQVFGGGELQHFRRTLEVFRTRLARTINSPAPAITNEDFYELGTRYVAEIKRLAPGVARITDKMTGNFTLAGLIQLALPNATIIHTIRDPVDTCLSCFSKLFGEGELGYTYDLAELGRYYRHYQALMEHWHRALPPRRILDVRYEDVVADLEGQARRIIEHCGLDWDRCCLMFHKTERPVRTVSAPQVREPIYSHAIGRWRVHESRFAPLLTELRLRAVPIESPRT